MAPRLRSSEPTFPVEKILKHQFNERGKIEYLVKWRGYTQKTWEPSERLAATDVLKAYHAKIGPAALGKLEPGGTRPKRGGLRAGQSTNAKISGPSKNVDGQRSYDFPQGSWESSVSRVLNIVRPENCEGACPPRYDGILEWTSGNARTQHSLETLRVKCPQKLLDYYEANIKFTTTETPA